MYKIFTQSKNKEGQIQRLRGFKFRGDNTSLSQYLSLVFPASYGLRVRQNVFYSNRPTVNCYLEYYLLFPQK